jgi:hypothetical protein
MSSDISHRNLFYWPTHQEQARTPKIFISGSRGAKYWHSVAATTTFLQLHLVFMVTGCGLYCVSPSGVESFEVALGFLENVFNILHIRRDHCRTSLSHAHPGALRN